MVVARNVKEHWLTLASVTLLFLFLWGLSWWLNRALTFFSSDTGLRFIQVRKLIASQWQTLAINYPGRIFDPDLLYVPYYFAYAVVDNEIFLNVTPFMPWVASWGYAAWGVPGMMLVPVWGGVLTAVAVYCLARLSRLSSPHLVLWLTVFATPVFFYSVEFWDHTLAAATATWSIYFLARGLMSGEKRWLILAGIIVGLGLGQRPEMYLFALCLGVGALWASGWQWRLLLPVVVGGMITAVPIWLWQYSQFGHPLGMALATHLLGYGQPTVDSTDAVRISRYLIMNRMIFLVEARYISTFIASLSVLIGLILFILVVRGQQWQRPGLWRLVGIVFLTGYGLLVVRAMSSITVIGVVATFPLIIFTLLFTVRSVPQQPARLVYELVFVVAFLFFAGMLVLWPAFGGLQWGSRYLLPFFPLAVYLAFYNYHHLLAAWQDWRRVELKRLMAAVIVVSLLLQMAGYYMQFGRHQTTGLMRDDIAALATPVVVTNGRFLPAEAAALAEVIFLSVKDSDDLQVLIPRFWEQGVTEFAAVPFLHPLPVPSQVEELSVREIRPFVYELSEK